MSFLRRFLPSTDSEIGRIGHLHRIVLLHAGSSEPERLLHNSWTESEFWDILRRRQGSVAFKTTHFSSKAFSVCKTKSRPSSVILLCLSWKQPATFVFSSAKRVAVFLMTGPCLWKACYHLYKIHPIVQILTCKSELESSCVLTILVSYFLDRTLQQERRIFWFMAKRGDLQRAHNSRARTMLQHTVQSGVLQDVRWDGDANVQRWVWTIANLSDKT